MRRKCGANAVQTKIYKKKGEWKKYNILFNEMIRETVKHGLPEPVFEDTKTSIIVTFKKFILREEDLQGLNERQRRALEFLRIHQKLTTSEYQKTINKPLVTAKRDLMDLRKKKIIEYVGSLRKGYYRLVSK